MCLRTRCSANDIRSLRLSELCGLVRYSSRSRSLAGESRRTRGREREMEGKLGGEYKCLYFVLCNAVFAKFCVVSSVKHAASSTYSSIGYDGDAWTV
jgi:hypothetical protein